MATPDPSKAWEKAPKQEKLLFVLAVATLIAVFLPWMSVPFLAQSFGYSISGFNSVGMLTFFGALAYLLWKILPLLNVKIPKINLPDLTIQKILGVGMLAGPALWIFNSGFELSLLGYGLWVALVASGIFVYLSFAPAKK